MRVQGFRGRSTGNEDVSCLELNWRRGELVKTRFVGDIEVINIRNFSNNVILYLFIFK